MKDDPSPEQIREFIQAQKCPWCGRDGFKVLARHTNVAHGISAKELRELALLLKTVSICAPEHAENCRERPQMEILRQSRRSGARKSAELSTAGRTSLIESGRRLATRYPPAGNPLMWQRAPRARCNVCGRQIPADLPHAAVTCSPECRGKAQAARNSANKRRPRGTCAVCGDQIPFVRGRTAWKTCSQTCRATLRSRAATNRNRARWANRDTPDPAVVASSA